MNNNTGRKRVRRARRQNKATISRILLTVGMMALVAVVSIGGTLAWLTDDTETITNTFTKSDVTVELTESATTDNDEDPLTNSYQMVPGNKITKDPKVKLTAGSEDSWVFVQFEEIGSFDYYMSYQVTEDWTALDGEENVYYYNKEITKDADIQVLKDNEVVVSDQLTKADMSTAETTPPQLKVKAYACQKANVETAAEAWSYIQNDGKTPTP